MIVTCQLACLERDASTNVKVADLSAQSLEPGNIGRHLAAMTKSPPTAN
jgi:hypothetical protein